MSDDSIPDRLRSVFTADQITVNAEPIETGRVGSFDPPSECQITAESVAWLVDLLAGETEAHVETVELDTTQGTFVFASEDGHIVIRHRDGESDE
jgi:hypothetical protein